MKKLGRLLFGYSFSLFGCPTYCICRVPKDITVSAAISLKNAFEEIGRLYESQYGTKCIFNFGASGDLVKQIVGGAPVDVFASAAQKDMDDVDKQGLIVAGTRADFAANSVVLIVPAGAKTITQILRGFERSGNKEDRCRKSEDCSRRPVCGRGFWFLPDAAFPEG